VNHRNKANWQILFPNDFTILFAQKNQPLNPVAYGKHHAASLRFHRRSRGATVSREPDNAG